MIMKYRQVYNTVKRVRRKNKLLSERDLMNILSFGMSAIARTISKGHDVIVQEKAYNHPIVIGPVQQTEKAYESYYRQKLIKKIRTLYYRYAKKQDDNEPCYYYFALGTTKYKKYMNQRRCHLRTQFDFGKITLYRILEECIISTHQSKRIFRVEMPKCFTQHRIVWWNFKLHISRFQLILYRPRTTRRRMVIEYRNLCVRFGLRHKHF